VAITRQVAITQIHDNIDLTYGIKKIKRIIHEIKIIKNQCTKIETNALIRTKKIT
jgi:hypothetical protein